MSVATGTDRWTRRYRPRPWCRARLVCLPHASGSATFYRSWAAELPDDVELVAVQYPGRLDRISEPCVEDMATMADALATALRPMLAGPVYLFGHSMGAAVAYEVVHLLQQRHGLSPAGLFVSGHPAPHLHRPGVKHLGSDELLWSELRRLGGTPPAALELPELRAALMPTLRADYRLVETYRPTLAPVGCPLVALSGDRDPEASVAEVAQWERYTRSDFRLHVFAGDHFYLVPRRADVLGVLAEAIARRTPVP